MKPIATKENCINCRHQEATRAGECLPCHAVTLLMVGTIQEHWPIEQYKELGDELQNSTTREFLDHAKEHKAAHAWKLGENIFRLASLAKMPTEQFKEGVIRRMRDNLKEHEGNTDKEGWMRRVNGFIGGLAASLNK